MRNENEMKRCIDLLISYFYFCCFYLIIFIVALLIKLKLGSPVIFKQQRPGLNEKPFYLYKFRTMKDQRDQQGNLLPDHIRLTSFGQFLRKYSLG